MLNSVPKAVLAGIAGILVLAAIGSFLPQEKTVKKSPTVAEQSTPTPSPVDVAKVEALFDRIEKQYGYRPRLDTWGPGKGLFVPIAAWYGIKSTDQLLLIRYCRNEGVRAIVVGEVKSKDVITLDKEVWTNQAK